MMSLSFAESLVRAREKEGVHFIFREMVRIFIANPELGLSFSTRGSLVLIRRNVEHSVKISKTG